MTYTTSLYDALTGINIPKTQALAVVEALEQKMTSEPAIKLDIFALQGDAILIKSDVAVLESDVEALKCDAATLKSDVRTIKDDFATFRHGLDQLRIDTSKDNEQLRLSTPANMNALENRLTVRLGSLMGAMTLTLFAALQVTLG